MKTVHILKQLIVSLKGDAEKQREQIAQNEVAALSHKHNLDIIEAQIAEHVQAIKTLVDSEPEDSPVKIVKKISGIILEGIHFSVGEPKARHDDVYTYKECGAKIHKDTLSRDAEDFAMLLRGVFSSNSVDTIISRYEDFIQIRIDEVTGDGKISARFIPFRDGHEIILRELSSGYQDQQGVEQ